MEHLVVDSLVQAVAHSTFPQVPLFRAQWGKQTLSQIELRDPSPVVCLSCPQPSVPSDEEVA